MNLRELTHDQVKEYIHTEHQKGRPMREVIQEVIAVRDDFVLLPANPKVANAKMLEALGLPFHKP
jgi:hypothetical protein